MVLYEQILFNVSKNLIYFYHAKYRVGWSILDSVCVNVMWYITKETVMMFHGFQCFLLPLAISGN
jgi:hypothetical protein